jgi:hypothetical protein
VEIVSPDLDAVRLGVAELEASGIGVGISLALHLQPGFGLVAAMSWTMI